MPACFLPETSGDWMVRETGEVVDEFDTCRTGSGDIIYRERGRRQLTVGGGKRNEPAVVWGSKSEARSWKW